LTAIHKPFPVVSEVPEGIQHNGGNPKMSRQKEKRNVCNQESHLMCHLISEFMTHVALSRGTVTMLYKVFLALKSMEKILLFVHSNCYYEVFSCIFYSKTFFWRSENAHV